MTLFSDCAHNNPFFSHKQPLNVDKWIKYKYSPINWASLLSFELKGEKVSAHVKTLHLSFLIPTGTDRGSTVFLTYLLLKKADEKVTGR